MDDSEHEMTPINEAAWVVASEMQTAGMRVARALLEDQEDRAELCLAVAFIVGMGRHYAAWAMLMGDPPAVAMECCLHNALDAARFAARYTRDERPGLERGELPGTVSLSVASRWLSRAVLAEEKLAVLGLPSPVAADG